MRLQTKKFSLAAALTMSIVYLICATLVALWPEFSSRLMSQLIHAVNLNLISVSWTNFIGGLVQTFIYTYLTSFVFAWLYNRFLDS